MKIARLLEIVTILLNRKTITATELSRRFEVSVRTIYRDIDVLSAAGVPIFTMQGSGGGISIMDEYSIDRAILNDHEKNSILLALKTLQAIQYPEIDQVLEKLGSAFRQNISDWIAIDFSPWGADPNQYDKFANLKMAILKTLVIEIDYINSRNVRTTRAVEPHRLVFKSQAWYLWGFCQLRQDYRTFRISRIKRVAVGKETFDRSRTHIVPADRPDPSQPLFTHCVLRFQPEALYRLFDDFDDDALVHNDDGSYTASFDMPEDDWLYGYILSFGPGVRVIEPKRLARIIKERAEKIVRNYT